MSSRRKRLNPESSEQELIEAEAHEPVELEEVTAEPASAEPVIEPVAEPVVEQAAALTATFSRDDQGRIVIVVPDLPKRIAGDDAALPETLRLLGLDIVKRALV